MWLSTVSKGQVSTRSDQKGQGPVHRRFNSPYALLSLFDCITGIWYFINFRHIVRWLNMCIHWEMVITISLVTTSHLTKLIYYWLYSSARGLLCSWGTEYLQESSFKKGVKLKSFTLWTFNVTVVEMGWIMARIDQGDQLNNWCCKAKRWWSK